MKASFYQILLLLLCTSSLQAQYSSKKVNIDNDEYKGFAEVCTNCSGVKAEAQKSYRWLKNGKIEESKGSFQGELLHGKLELYAEGFDGGKEPIIEGNFKAGLADGTIKNYIFGGILETVEVFENGVLKSREYYSTDEDKSKNKALKKFEYLDQNPQRSKIKMHYYGTSSKLVGEGYQVTEGSTFSNFYDGKYQKFFIDADGKEYVKEEGTFSKNRRNGTWTIYYNDGISARAVYKDDLLEEEQFLKDGQPYTGTVQDLTPNRKSLRASINVKNGLRDGNTLDSYANNSEKKWEASRTIEYKNGQTEHPNFSLKQFLQKEKINSEAELSKQCDQERGNDLYIDRIKYTATGALVFFHHYNNGNGSTSRIYTDVAGGKLSFAALDINTNKVFKMKQVFNLATIPHFNISYSGELTSFVIFFEGLTPATKKVSFIEGDPENPYTVDAQGNTTYHWGCYELLIK